MALFLDWTNTCVVSLHRYYNIIVYYNHYCITSIILHAVMFDPCAFYYLFFNYYIKYYYDI